MIGIVSALVALGVVVLILTAANAASSASRCPSIWSQV
jgi:hypothetical protein